MSGFYRPGVMQTRPRRPAPVVLMFSEIFAFGLACVGLGIMQRHRTPPDALASGPLHSGVYFFLPALCAYLYLFAATAITAKRYNTVSSLRITVVLCSGLPAMATLAVLSLCATASLTGVRADWAAGDSGLTVQQPWRSGPHFHPWSEAVSRSLSCYHVKSGVHPAFRVRLRDGEDFNLAAGESNAAFLHRAPRFLELTNGVSQSSVGDISICPKPIADLMAGQAFSFGSAAH